MFLPRAMHGLIVVAVAKLRFYARYCGCFGRGVLLPGLIQCTVRGWLSAAASASAAASRPRARHRRDGQFDLLYRLHMHFFECIGGWCRATFASARTGFGVALAIRVGWNVLCIHRTVFTRRDIVVQFVR